MPRPRKEQIRASIEALNSIQVGELSGIDARLQAARDEVAKLQEPELETTVEQARVHLREGDVASFRRLVSQAVSRLGHLR